MARGAMAATAEELEDVLCLDFSDVGEPDRDVTPSNRSEFVRKLIYHTLIGQRKVSCRGCVLSLGALSVHSESRCALLVYLPGCSRCHEEGL